jgi:carboxyl-terminal processing protease
MKPSNAVGGAERTAVRRALAWVVAAVALLAGALPGGGPARGQAVVVEPEVRIVAPDVSQWIEKGRRLEAEGRWSDAVTHWEEASRKHPERRDFEQSFELAKLRYDLERRYADPSFRRLVDTMPAGDSIQLYSELLLKIHGNYVDAPDWRRITTFGAQAFDIALGDASFDERHLPGTPAARIDAFRRDLRKQLGAASVRDRIGSRAFVEATVRRARQELGLSETAATMEFVAGAAAGLDAYSAFLTADQLTDVYSQIDGNFVGLGVELKSQNEALAILKVIPGSPAAEGGLAAGDEILSVDGVTTIGKSTDEAAGQLQGTDGSVAELEVRGADGGVRRVRLQRRHVEVPSIEDARIVDEATGVAYLRLTCFQKTTTRDLDQALWRLHRDGMRSLIVDVRGNPGGLLTSSVEVVDRFVDRGAIVSTKGRVASEDNAYSATGPGTWNMPLAVLIDGESASASEIFAGAIRDHQRGVLVGERSYGKGSVQGIFPLRYAQTGLRLTTAKFYSPNGLPFSRVGVEPEVRVQLAARPFEGAATLPPAEEDDALVAATNVLRQRTARAAAAGRREQE